MPRLSGSRFLLGYSLYNGTYGRLEFIRLRLRSISRTGLIPVLRRVRQLHHPLPANVQKENQPRQATIDDLFVSIAPDLQGIDAWRYQRQISAGLQEYMEAVSFQRYLETQQLITYEEAQKAVPGGVALTESDYVLGLFDLAGELMRFAITGMATTGTLPRSKQDPHEPESERDILMDLRELRTNFGSLDTTVGVADSSPFKRDVEKKMEVMKTCVEKVENAVCGMIIRGKERPKGWMPDLGGDERGREQEGEGY